MDVALGIMLMHVTVCSLIDLVDGSLCGLCVGFWRKAGSVTVACVPC